MKNFKTALQVYYVLLGTQMLLYVVKDGFLTSGAMAATLRVITFISTLLTTGTWIWALVILSLRLNETDHAQANRAFITSGKIGVLTLLVGALALSFLSTLRSQSSYRIGAIVSVLVFVVVAAVGLRFTNHLKSSLPS